VEKIIIVNQAYYSILRVSSFITAVNYILNCPILELSKTKDCISDQKQAPRFVLRRLKLKECLSQIKRNFIMFCFCGVLNMAQREKKIKEKATRKGMKDRLRMLFVRLQISKFFHQSAWRNFFMYIFNR